MKDAEATKSNHGPQDGQPRGVLELGQRDRCVPSHVGHPVIGQHLQARDRPPVVQLPQHVGGHLADPGVVGL